MGKQERKEEREALKKQQEANRKDPNKRYQLARTNLMIMIAFTVVNLVIALAQMDFYFLFKAFLPELIINALWETAPAAGIGIAVLLVGFYVLCWVLSKKRKGWMTAALVFFAADVAVMLSFVTIYFVNESFEADILIDILFEGYVLVCLISGVRAARAIDNASAEEPIPVRSLKEDTTEIEHSIL